MGDDTNSKRLCLARELCGQCWNDWDGRLCPSELPATFRMLAFSYGFHPSARQTVENRMSGYEIRRKRDIMNVTDSPQCGDVRFVWMGGQRVTEKNHGIAVLCGDPRGDQYVAAERPGFHAFDSEISRFVEALPGRSRGDTFTLAEE